MTQSGYEQLQEELEHLRTVKRPEVVEKIKVARSFGDLSENSEYDAAKDEQGFVEQEITKIEDMLRHAKIIYPQGVDGYHGGLVGRRYGIGRHCTDLLPVFHTIRHHPFHIRQGG